MTIITVRALEGALSRSQRAELATTLTDAVLLVECGQLSDAARWGFQVQFADLAADRMAIGGTLVDELGGLAPLTVDITVMDGHWPPEDRAMVIERTFAALAAAVGVDAIPPTWWVTFRTIDDGSWGANGHHLPISTLLDSGLFTPERADAITSALNP